jgi:hypothetical protein
MSKSSLALSNLRAVVILLVVAFHSVLAHLGCNPLADAPSIALRITGDDPIRTASDGLASTCSASQYVYLNSHAFSVCLSGRVRGARAKAFLPDLRLAPFVIGVFLLMPVAHCGLPHDRR